VAKLGSSEIDRSVLLEASADYQISHVRRSCNGVAHVFAKEGCDNKVCNVWVGSPSELVRNLVSIGLCRFKLI
jgi:hypothetical protein